MVRSFFERIYKGRRFTSKLIGVLLGLAAIAYYLFSDGSSADSYDTVALVRGNIVNSISATGTLQPEEVIDVGAQVAGQILAFGKDIDGKQIDYGSTIDEGTILAQIDEELYLSDVKTAVAALEKAEADLIQAQAKLAQANNDWKRAQKLGPSDALSETAYDSYQAAYLSAKGGVAVVKAQISQAQAALAKAKRNLSYCVIRSPVKGVIIDRRVNIGQTVVSSLNAPSLFLIAKDLRKMQVWVAVNEADIGNIKVGQEVIFTVDAFPDEEFKGSVGKVRLNAAITQNVVTYIVEVVTDNSSGKLLPYLTANVQFVVGRIDNALLVPAAALRWQPLASTATRQIRDASESKDKLWIYQSDSLIQIPVQILMTDGTVTAVSGAELTEGMAVIVERKDPQAAQTSNTKNPFAPAVHRRRN